MATQSPMPKEAADAWRARPGDRVVVHPHAVSQPSREELILEVIGVPGHERHRVRWDEEHESIFYPGSDATIRKSIAEGRADAGAHG